MAEYKPEYTDKRMHRGLRKVGNHYERFVGTQDFGYTIIYDANMQEIDRVEEGESIISED